MTIEEQREHYRRLRRQLPPQSRASWDVIVVKKSQQRPPPTPSEWIDYLNTFLSENRYQQALDAWVNLRLSDEHFYGEDPDPVQDVVGWDVNLSVESKTTLLNLQFNEDLNWLMSFEQWEHNRD